MSPFDGMLLKVLLKGLKAVTFWLSSSPLPLAVSDEDVAVEPVRIEEDALLANEIPIEKL